jgi:hypothetical protein
MTAALISTVGGIVLMVLQMWAEYLKGAPERKKKADAITKRDMDELDAGMRRVDGL